MVSAAGHNVTKNSSGAIQPGICACGCGQATNLASRNRQDRGWKKGAPLRWIHGHARRKLLRYVETDTGYATPCWIWQLAKDTHGYGAVWQTNRTAQAHCVAYQEKVGPVPNGAELDHLCRVRCCVNPDHLDPVSHAENCQRGKRTKLSAPQVAEIRASSDTQRVIARRYGISQSQVARIIVTAN